MCVHVHSYLNDVYIVNYVALHIRMPQCGCGRAGCHRLGRGILYLYSCDRKDLHPHFTYNCSHCYSSASHRNDPVYVVLGERTKLRDGVLDIPRVGDCGWSVDDTTS